MRALAERVLASKKQSAASIKQRKHASHGRENFNFNKHKVPPPLSSENMRAMLERILASTNTKCRLH